MLINKKIYVRKNISSLDKIGNTIAHFLKKGLPVQIQYGEKERDIVVRFHKRMEPLYHDDLENHNKVEYPKSGFVVYDINKATTSETKIEKVEGYRGNIKGIIVLVYDPLYINTIRDNIKYFWVDFCSFCGINASKKEKKEKERW